MASRSNNSETADATGVTLGCEAQLWRMAGASCVSTDAAGFKRVVRGLVFR